MNEFCRSHHGLCTSVDQMHDKGSLRTKRVAGWVIGLIIGGIIGTASAGGSMYSILQSKKLHAEIALLNETMNELTNSMVAMTKGMRLVQRQTVVLAEYMASEVADIYEVIEQLRCQQFTEQDHFQKQVGIHLYRSHLTRQLDNIMETASTGRVTPGLIGVDQVKRLLKSNPSLSDSLMSLDTSLFYKYAVAYPVRFDFKGLSFGYILRLINPSREDLFPLYRIYNVGFHMSANDPAGIPASRNHAYFAELPKYAILRGAEGLSPLQSEDCLRDPGLFLCETGSAVGSHKPGCLDVFTTINCSNCAPVKECFKHISQGSEEAQRATVISTPAGVLIRSIGDGVKVYVDNPRETPGSLGKLVRPTVSGTY